ncbi:MAG: hypothetical protein JO243_22950 [Solirubrobacterales bacterium]|nr:hypothetical protein [Solirubrobacterales bacterium]
MKDPAQPRLEQQINRRSTRHSAALPIPAGWPGIPRVRRINLARSLACILPGLLLLPPLAKLLLTGELRERRLLLAG